MHHDVLRKMAVLTSHSAESTTLDMKLVHVEASGHPTCNDQPSHWLISLLFRIFDVLRYLPWAASPLMYVNEVCMAESFCVEESLSVLGFVWVVAMLFL